jgi:hypothetical protein
MNKDVYGEPTIIKKGNFVALDLTSSQITDLAKPFTNMIESITKFYENPKVKKGFEEWHLKKFGRKPNEVSV